MGCEGGGLSSNSADTGLVRQAQHFERAGPVGEAADETALLEPGDQPVDTRLGFEPEGVFHLIEGGRNAGRVEPFVDESEKLVLLARQHVVWAPKTRSVIYVRQYHNIWNKPQTSTHVLVMFF